MGKRDALPTVLDFQVQVQGYLVVVLSYITMNEWSRASKSPKRGYAQSTQYDLSHFGDEKCDFRPFLGGTGPEIYAQHFEGNVIIIKSGLRTLLRRC